MKPLASPAVRALARKHHMPLTHVAGTGPQGRITKGKPLVGLDQPKEYNLLMMKI